LKTYTIQIPDFVNAEEVDRLFDEVGGSAHTGMGRLLVDFSRLKVLDCHTFDKIVGKVKALQMCGTQAYICGVPPHIAALTASWASGKDIPVYPHKSESDG
jgi:anti-anti-sigma regulatory factor